MPAPRKKGAGKKKSAAKGAATKRRTRRHVARAGAATRARVGADADRNAYIVPRPDPLSPESAGAQMAARAREARPSSVPPMYYTEEQRGMSEFRDGEPSRRRFLLRRALVRDGYRADEASDAAGNVVRLAKWHDDVERRLGDYLRWSRLDDATRAVAPRPNIEEVVPLRNDVIGSPGAEEWGLLEEW
eukprot:jgi/Mesvir1/11149/Mv04591-RA.1